MTYAMKTLAMSVALLESQNSELKLGKATCREKTDCPISSPFRILASSGHRRASDHTVDEFQQTVSWPRKQVSGPRRVHLSATLSGRVQRPLYQKEKSRYEIRPSRASSAISASSIISRSEWRTLNSSCGSPRRPIRNLHHLTRSSRSRSWFICAYDKNIERNSRRSPCSRSKKETLSSSVRSWLSVPAMSLLQYGVVGQGRAVQANDSAPTHSTVKLDEKLQSQAAGKLQLELVAFPHNAHA